MNNNFSSIAPVYDSLARLVFGRSLEHAQRTFLSEIGPKAKVLIVGGGTGQIIDWIPQGLGLQIDYVELSKGMLQRAKDRSSEGNRVDFILGDVSVHQGSYDVIIANFFLDCFSTAQLVQVLKHLKDQLGAKGRLLVTDFYPSDRPSDRLLLKTMHCFFRIMSRLDAHALTNIHEQTKLAGFEPKGIQFFRKGLVFSAVYESSI